MLIFKKEITKVNRYIELCNPFPRIENHFSRIITSNNSRERIAIRKTGMSYSRERIINLCERITNPWKRIAQFNIRSYLKTRKDQKERTECKSYLTWPPFRDLSIHFYSTNLQLLVMFTLNDIYWIVLRMRGVLYHEH